MTGAELNAHSDDELKEKLKKVHIFARLIPEQKLRIVKMLEAATESLNKRGALVYLGS